MSKREICKVAFMVVLLISVICQAELVSHWKFDTNSGTTAYDSAGSNNGIIMGAQWTDGKDGYALEFDGNDDYVTAPSIPDLPMSDHTVTAWVKCSPGLDSADIVAGGQSKFWALSYSEYHSVYQAKWEDQVDEREGVWSDSPPEMDTWTHLAMRRKDGEYSLFVNGIKQTETEAVDTDFQADNPVIIGAAHLVGGYYFEGAVDDVQIYDHGLSDSEIAAIPEPAGIALLFAGCAFLRRRN